MIFKKVFIFFQNNASIVNLNFQNLLNEITTRNGNQHIYAVYLGSKYLETNNLVNLNNNIDKNTISLKIFEECIPSINPLTGTVGYFLTLLLDDAPSQIWQSTNFNINKYNSELALLPVPSSRVGITYNDTVVKPTIAADLNSYQVSRCDNYFISPSLERIESVYGDLTISSPFPISIGAYQTIDSIPIMNIVFNSNSISNPIPQTVPDIITKQPCYFMANKDPTQFTMCNLITIISDRMSIEIRDDKKPYKPGRYAFDLRPIQNIYAYVSTNPNDFLYYNDPNGDEYVGVGRFDHHITFKFVKKSPNSSISCIWGYFSIQTTNYTQKSASGALIPKSNAFLMNFGVPTNNLITCLLQNGIFYTPVSSDPNVRFILKMRMDYKQPYITFNSDSKSFVIITSYPFLQLDKFAVPGYETVFLKILQDRTYSEQNNWNILELNNSNISKTVLSFTFEKDVPASPYELINLEIAGSVKRINQTTYSYSEYSFGKYVSNGIAGWTLEPDDSKRFFTFTKATNPSFKDEPFFVIQNFKSCYGFRLATYVTDLDQYNFTYIIQGTDLQQYLSQAFTIAVNQLYTFSAFSNCPGNTLIMVVNAAGRNTPWGVDEPQSATFNTFFEVVNEQPKYIDYKTTPIDLPPSYLSSAIDTFNDSNYYAFNTSNIETVLNELTTYIPKIIRQDYKAVQEENPIALDQSFRKDFYSIRIPNFYKIFPLFGYNNYTIPYDNLELRYIYDNQIFTQILPKDYSFTIKETSQATKLYINSDSKLCHFDINTNNSTYDIFLYLKIDRSQDQKLYLPYKRLKGTIKIANCSSEIPIEVYTNLIKSYYDLTPLYVSSTTSSYKEANGLVMQNIHIYKIKLPIINIDTINAYNLTTQTLETNDRQLLMTLLLEISFFT